MLVNESRFTPLSYDIKNQIKRLVTAFINTHIARRGKLSNLTLDQSKQNVKKMISKSKYKSIFIGYIHLGKTLNKEIPIFISETGSGGSYIEEDGVNNEHIIISFDTIFGDLETSLSILAHEVIHAIQEYKTASPEYYKAAEKISNSQELSSEENFIYYTEPSEFEANATQLSYIITRFFERKDIDKDKVLYILDSVLKYPKSKMHKFFNSMYLKYILNKPEEDHEIYMSYLREIFITKMDFLKTISLPPNNSPKNIKISDRYWKQFKQKLFNLVQYLKKRQLKNQKSNK